MTSLACTGCPRPAGQGLTLGQRARGPAGLVAACFACLVVYVPHSSLFFINALSQSIHLKNTRPSNLRFCITFSKKLPIASRVQSTMLFYITLQVLYVIIIAVTIIFFFRVVVTIIPIWLFVFVQLSVRCLFLSLDWKPGRVTPLLFVYDDNPYTVPGTVQNNR